MGAGDIALTLLRWPWLVLPGLGAIRVSTILAALLIAAAIAWLRRSPFLALVTVMAWAALYEVAFNALGALLHGWSISYVVWLTAALAGWVALAAVRGVVPDLRLAIACVVVTVAWIATGFDANSISESGAGYTRSFSYLDEAFNEVTKTLLGAAYLVGALQKR